MSVTQSCDLYWPLVPCEAQSSESWTVRKYSVSAFLVRGSVVGEVFSPVRMSSVWDYFPLCCWLTGCPLTQHGYALIHKQSRGSAHKHGAARSTRTWRVAFIWFASPWWRRSFSTWLEWARVNIAFKRTPLSAAAPLAGADTRAGISAESQQRRHSLCWQPRRSWWTGRVSAPSALGGRRRWPVHGRLSANGSLDKYTVQRLANCPSVVSLPLS